MSTPRRSWSWKVFVFCANAPALWAGDTGICTAARSERIDALTTIGLEPVGFPPRLANVTADGAALWNRAPCAATSRPRFVVGRGERTIVVRWIEGAAPVTPGICGSFSGREIRLFAFALDPADGRLRRCGENHQLVEILAHELGHTLGLLDQWTPRCGDRIMGQLMRRADGSVAARRVHAEECSAADGRFVTSAERIDLVRSGAQIASLGVGSRSAAALP